MKNSVSDIDFCRAYNSSDSTAEVAEKTGMSQAAVNSRAANYRRKGALLKRLGRKGPAAINVDGINRMLAEEGLLPDVKFVPVADLSSASWSPEEQIAGANGKSRKSRRKREKVKNS